MWHRIEEKTKDRRKPREVREEGEEKEGGGKGGRRK
jgi:hypothetical protein